MTTQNTIPQTSSSVVSTSVELPQESLQEEVITSSVVSTPTLSKSPAPKKLSQKVLDTSEEESTEDSTEASSEASTSTEEETSSTEEDKPAAKPARKEILDLVKREKAIREKEQEVKQALELKTKLDDAFAIGKKNPIKMFNEMSKLIGFKSFEEILEKIGADEIKPDEDIPLSTEEQINLAIQKHEEERLQKEAAAKKEAEEKHAQEIQQLELNVIKEITDFAKTKADEYPIVVAENLFETVFETWKGFATHKDPAKRKNYGYNEVCQLVEDFRTKEIRELALKKNLLSVSKDKPETSVAKQSKPVDKSKKTISNKQTASTQSIVSGKKEVKKTFATDEERIAHILSKHNA